MSKIYFGSLEKELPNAETEENNIKGISLEELEIDETAAHTQLTDLQSLYLQKVESTNRGKQIPIPTDDLVVRKWLRAVGEPVTLFGEGPYDRRERLRRLATTQSSLYKTLSETFSTSEQEYNAEEIKDTEEFFVPGSDDLVKWRRWLVEFGVKRAKLRLEREKLFRSRPASEAKIQRLEVYEHMRAIKLMASQIGGDRPLSACSISLDASLIATGGLGGSCRIWSREDCSLVRELEGVHKARIGSVIFNPNLDNPCAIASCDSDGKIALWQLNQSNCLGQLVGHTARVARLDFHPSGNLLASASFDYSWRLWDLERQTELQLQEGHSKPVYSVAFHPDGALVASGGLDAHGRLWDLRLGRAIWTLQGHVKSILSVSFSSKLPVVATSSEDATIRLWDLRKLQPLYILPAHPSVIPRVIFSTGGELLLSAGFEGNAKIWSAVDYKLLNNMAAHEGKILDIDWSNDASTIVTASHDHTFKLWSYNG